MKLLVHAKANKLKHLFAQLCHYIPAYRMTCRVVYLSSVGCELEIGQACYLPLPPKDAPVIGKIPYYKGRLYIAAGHYCWGILNGPATGKGLAELIIKGQSSIDLSPFDPVNFL